MSRKRQAFILLCHNVSIVEHSAYTRLRKAVSGKGDLFVLLHCHELPPPPRIPRSWNCIPFTNDDIFGLGYPTIGEGVTPGHAHFPLLKFYLGHPDYERYWVIEYDVYFNGNWRVFFDAFSKLEGDFFTCHIRRHHDEPEWCWWSLNHPTETIPQEERLRSFNPIYCISSRALNALDRMQKTGWVGHNEVIVPTLLHKSGFTLVDFGGDGEFVHPGFEDRFYSSESFNSEGKLNKGTMRWRPIFKRVGPHKNKLYHPVKTHTPPIASPLGIFLLAKKALRRISL